MKHTPGPWEVMKDYPLFIKANGHLIAETTVKGFGKEDCPTPEEAKANAQLMASALILLDACKDALDEFNDPNRGPSGSMPAIISLEQAIQKATP